MELISIIIPIYNLEKYISRCLNSIKQQTYKNFEVIIIDDGSDDNSYYICKKFCENDNRFQVYYIDNHGVSFSRNYGLKRAKGKYIFFIDGDDYITPTYIQNFMMYDDYDLIAGGYHINSMNGKEKKYDNLLLTIDEYKNECIHNWNSVPSVVVWGNRYKRDIIVSNNLCFDENCSCGEDVRFNVFYFLHINNIQVVNNTEYIYCLRSESAIHKYWPNRCQEEKEEAQIKELLLGNAYDFDWIKFIHWDIALNHYYSFYINQSIEKREIKNKIKQCINDRYFRTSIPFILKNGTVDMRIEAFCLKFHSYTLYKKIMDLYVLVKERLR